TSCNAIRLPPGKLNEKVVGYNSRPRQPMIKSKPGGADQEPGRHYTWVDSGCHSPRGLFHHLLFLGREAHHLREALVAKGSVRRETDRINYNLIGHFETFEQRSGDVSGSRVWIDPRPHLSVLFRFVREPHSLQELDADEHSHIRDRVRGAAVIT